MQLGRGLAQAQLDVAQLVAGALELGREPLERRDRALGERDEAGGALALLGRQRLGGGRSAASASSETCRSRSRSARSALLPARLDAVGVLDERAQLVEPRLRERGVRGQLLVPPPRRRAARATRARASARRFSCSSPQNRSSTSSWYAGRASRRCSNWPDIAMTRSTAAATSSRAAARPHA